MRLDRSTLSPYLNAVVIVLALLSGVWSVHERARMAQPPVGGNRAPLQPDAQTARAPVP